MNTNAFIIMGVSGSGKSTVARLLAEKLDWDFLDADDFHPPENIAKMANGIPLNDSGRAPWLATLHDKLGAMLIEGRHPVLACSALKQRYRDQLSDGNSGLQLVYLKGEYDLIWARISERRGHYMAANMLKSQFDALEEPNDALVVDVSLPPDEILKQILHQKFR